MIKIVHGLEFIERAGCHTHTPSAFFVFVFRIRFGALANREKPQIGLVTEAVLSLELLSELTGLGVNWMRSCMQMRERNWQYTE